MYYASILGNVLEYDSVFGSIQILNTNACPVYGTMSHRIILWSGIIDVDQIQVK